MGGLDSPGGRKTFLAVRTPFAVAGVVGELRSATGTTRRDECIGDVGERTIIGKKIRHENGVGVSA